MRISAARVPDPDGAKPDFANNRERARHGLSLLRDRARCKGSTPTRRETTARPGRLSPHSLPPQCHSREGGNPDKALGQPCTGLWIPACAGMTTVQNSRVRDSQPALNFRPSSRNPPTPPIPCSNLPKTYPHRCQPPYNTPIPPHGRDRTTDGAGDRQGCGPSSVPGLNGRRQQRNCRHGRRPGKACRPEAHASHLNNHRGVGASGLRPPDQPEARDRWTISLA